MQQAGTSAGALEAFDRTRFDVAFLDVWLASESGLTVLPELLRRQPGVRLIVVTALATYGSAVEAMKLGAADDLPKPFTPEQVRHAAQRIVTTGLLRRRVSELQDRLDATLPRGQRMYHGQPTRRGSAVGGDDGPRRDAGRSTGPCPTHGYCPRADSVDDRRFRLGLRTFARHRRRAAWQHLEMAHRAEAARQSGLSEFDLTDFVSTSKTAEFTALAVVSTEPRPQRSG